MCIGPSENGDISNTPVCHLNISRLQLFQVFFLNDTCHKDTVLQLIALHCSINTFFKWATLLFIVDTCKLNNKAEQTDSRASALSLYHKSSEVAAIFFYLYSQIEM